MLTKRIYYKGLAMDIGIFKWLWRFNAVVIGLAAAVFLVMSSVFLISEVSGLFYSGQRAEAVPVSATGTEAVAAPMDLQLGAVELPEGTEVLRVALRTGDRYGSGFSKYPSSSTVNIGIIDPGSLATRWLFAADHTLILQTADIFRIVRDAAGGDSVQAQAQASLYLVVRDDTDKDGALSAQDRADVMVSAVDGANLRMLVADVTGFSQSVMLDGATEMISYRDAAGQKLVKLDLPSLTLRGDAVALPLPVAP